MQTIADHLESFARPGRVEWIGLNPVRRGAMRVVGEVYASAASGLAGDHHAKRGPSRRQVTLIQSEHLAAIASFLGRDELKYEILRRNVAAAGINLLALKGRRFRVGAALLEWTGTCDPCSRMEEALGPGGLNAMRGHGGITARVLTDGAIRLGDAIEPAA